MTRVGAAPRSSETRNPSALGSTEHSSLPSEWIYELRPSSELPVVDLSISVKSYFFSPKATIVLEKMISFRRTLLGTAIFSLLVYPVSLVIDPNIGRPLALFTAFCGAPVTFAGICMLRFEVTKLVLATYDTAFFIILTITTYTAFAALLQDLRVVPLAISALSLVPNIFIDASLRAMHRIVIMTGLQIVTMAAAMIAFIFNLVPEAQSELSLVSYHCHTVPVKICATNGMASVIVLLIRNFYRKRDAIMYRDSLSQQRCVAYRARLHLRPSPCSELRGSSINGLDPTGTKPSSESKFVQQLRYDRSFQLIDARNTVWPAAFAYIAKNPRSTDDERRQKQIVIGFRVAMSIALLTTVFAYPIDRWIESLTNPHDDEHSNHGLPFVQVIALVLTILLMSFVVTLSQRDLLKAVITSFDYAYLSVQIVFLCVCACDFFEWNHHSLLVLVVCLWIHGLMAMDSLTPPVRALLRINSRGLALLLGLMLLGSSAAAVYLLVFNAETSCAINDRIIWSVQMSGTEMVHVTMMPFFYTFFFTVILLVLRILYRAATYAEVDLVIIDGPVAFSNCFRRTGMVGSAKSGFGLHLHNSRRNKRLGPRFPLVMVGSAQVAPVGAYT